MKNYKSQIWKNESEYLKVEMNGLPEYQALSFKLIGDQVRFLKAFDVPKTKLDEYLSKYGFQPVNKDLTLSEKELVS